LEFCESDDDVYEDYTRNASEKVKGIPKDPIRDIVFLSDEEIEILYNKLMKDERYKEATLLAILYDSGCRKNEILQVERATITEDGNATNIVKGKRGKKFKVLYFKRTKEAFKKYNATRTDNNPLLFVNSNGDNGTGGMIYDIVKKWIKDLHNLTRKDYEGLTVHSLRHAFVENCISGTHYICKEYGTGAIPLEKVKTLCHHESSDTTLGYSQNHDDKDIEDMFGISI